MQIYSMGSSSNKIKWWAYREENKPLTSTPSTQDGQVVVMEEYYDGIGGVMTVT